MSNQINYLEIKTLSIQLSVNVLLFVSNSRQHFQNYWSSFGYDCKIDDILYIIYGNTKCLLENKIKDLQKWNHIVQMRQKIFTINYQDDDKDKCDF